VDIRKYDDETLLRVLQHAEAAADLKSANAEPIEAEFAPEEGAIPE
jgi:hypothetical protein